MQYVGGTENEFWRQIADWVIQNWEATLAPKCNTCGQVIPITVKKGDVVRFKSNPGYVGVVTAVEHTTRSWLTVVLLGLDRGETRQWTPEAVDVIHGYIHVNRPDITPVATTSVAF